MCATFFQDQWCTLSGGCEKIVPALPPRVFHLCIVEARRGWDGGCLLPWGTCQDSFCGGEMGNNIHISCDARVELADKPKFGMWWG